MYIHTHTQLAFKRPPSVVFFDIQIRIFRIKKGDLREACVRFASVELGKERSKDSPYLRRLRSLVVNGLKANEKLKAGKV